MLGLGAMKGKADGTSRTERRDAAENRQRILDAALRLFDKSGVEQVSMNQIAIEAQIGAGTLYRRYRNKSELCLDLIKDNLDLLFEDIEAYLSHHADEPPGQRLEGVIRLFIRFREKKLQLLAGVEQAGSTGGSQTKRAQSPVYNELHELFVQLFNEMTGTAGTTSAEKNSVFKADMLLMALKSDSYQFQRDMRGLSSEEFLEQLIMTFVPN